MRIFENRVLRNTFGPKIEEVREDRTTLHNEGHDFYFSPLIIRVMKSQEMNWAGNMVCWGIKEKHTGFVCGSLKNYMGTLDEDGRTIKKWISKE
jgi:hypothetical protein